MNNATTGSSSGSSFGHQPWIRSARWDLLFIIGPAFLTVAIAASLPESVRLAGASSPWVWLALVVGVDVSHVYSTLYRTYFDRTELKSRFGLYCWVPVLCWGIGACLYSLGPLVFWRSLAYLAVFHFVRQQYGFFAIYSRNEEESRFDRMIGRTTLYLSMMTPLVLWHLSLPREFQWFVAGDFIDLRALGFGTWLGAAVLGIYLISSLTYIVREFMKWKKGAKFNWARNLLLVGTALSWSFGIVLTNDDLMFTATNVLSHGIPYLALVWWSGRKLDSQPDERLTIGMSRKHLFSLSALPVFLGILLAFAYFEEALWDGLIWREHGILFPTLFQSVEILPRVEDPLLLAFLIPLLALPQAVHYVLDGFIWKLNKASVTNLSSRQSSFLSENLFCSPVSQFDVDAASQIKGRAL